MLGHGGSGPPTSPICSALNDGALCLWWLPALGAGVVEEFKQSEEEMAADPVLKDGKGPLPVMARAPWSMLPLHKVGSVC